MDVMQATRDALEAVAKTATWKLHSYLSNLNHNVNLKLTLIYLHEEMKALGRIR